MQCGQPDRSSAPHSGDSKQNLGPKGTVNRHRGAPIQRAQGAGQNHQHADHCPGPPAVDEVDQIGVAGERVHCPLAPVDPGRDQLALHQGPGIPTKPPAARYWSGTKARHQSAIEQLQSQRGQRESPQPGEPRYPLALGMTPQIKRRPHQQRQGQQCQRQMGCEPQMADLDIVGQAGLDHPPANKALQSAQRQQAQQPGVITLRNCPPEPEPGQRQGKGQTDHPAEQAVKPFPEEYDLEPGQRHSGWPVDLGILRDPLIGPKRRLPLRFGQRRNCTGNRLPLGDRQARFSQPGDPADHHHQRDDGGDGEQPAGQGKRARAGVLKLIHDRRSAAKLRKAQA